MFKYIIDIIFGTKYKNKIKTNEAYGRDTNTGTITGLEDEGMDKNNYNTKDNTSIENTVSPESKPESKPEPKQMYKDYLKTNHYTKIAFEMCEDCETCLSIKRKKKK